MFNYEKKNYFLLILFCCIIQIKVLKAILLTMPTSAGGDYFSTEDFNYNLKNSLTNGIIAKPEFISAGNFDSVIISGVQFPIFGHQTMLSSNSLPFKFLTL
jgi:hypothetical protein